jgi:nucleoside-diphosphate kinase
MVEEHTCALIKPGYEAVWGKVIDRITQEGLKIVRLKTLKFDRAFSAQFYAEHVSQDFYPDLAQYITSGTLVALELVGRNAIAAWRRIIGPNSIAAWRPIIGPTRKEVAVAQAPNSLRALYARDTTDNVCHGSDSPESAAREIALVFGPRVQ